MNIQSVWASLPAAPGWAMLLAKATLVLGLGWLLHGVFANGNPRWRVLLWRVVAGGLVVLPLTLGSPVRLRVAIPEPQTPPSVRVAPLPTDRPMERFMAPSPSPMQSVSVDRAAPSNPVPTINTVQKIAPVPSKKWLGYTAMGIWFFVAALLLARWIAGWLLLRRLVREADPAPEWLDKLAAGVAADLGCRCVPVRLSARFAAPCLAGWRRPALILPAHMAGEDYRRELPAILAHEFSHLRSGDPFWMLALNALRIGLWFHPLAWRVGRAHAAACEEVSDAVTAEYVGDTGAYARTLARVASELAVRPAMPGGIAMARVPEIMRRLERLRRRVFTRPIAVYRASVFIGALGCGLLALGAVSVTQSISASPAKKSEKPTILPPGAIRRIGGRKLQQPGDVGALALSPDGKIMASGTISHGLVRLWDLDTGDKIKELPGPEQGTQALGFSPDGKVLAAVGNPRGLNGPGLFLYAMPSGEALHAIAPEQIEGNFGGPDLTALAFSHDGRELLTGGRDGQVRRWGVATGKELRRWPIHDRYIDSVAWSPDGRRAASGNSQGNLALWEIDSPNAPIKIKAAQHDLPALTFTPDGKYLVSGGGSYSIATGPQRAEIFGTVKIWNAATGHLERELESSEKDAAIASLGLAPDGSMLAVDYQKTIRLWDIVDGKEIKKLQGVVENRFGKCGMAFTPDGKRLVSGGQGNVIGVWDVDTGRRLFDDPASHTGAVRSVVFSPDGQKLYTSGAEGSVRGWDVNSGRQEIAFTNLGYADFITLSPDGRLLACVAPHDAAHVWELATGKELLKADAERDKQDVAVAAFSPRADLFALGYTSQDLMGEGNFPIRLWNLRTGEKIGELPGHESGVSAIGFGPDGRTLTSISQGGVFRIWNLADKTELTKMILDEDLVVQFHMTAVSADRQFFAYRRRSRSTTILQRQKGVERNMRPTLKDDTIVVWEIPKNNQFALGEELPHHVLRGQTDLNSFGHVGFTPDGRRVVASSLDQRVHIWDAAEGRETAVIEATGGSGRICSIAVSPDNRMLATGLEDGTVLLWPLDRF